MIAGGLAKLLLEGLRYLFFEYRKRQGNHSLPHNNNNIHRWLNFDLDPTKNLPDFALGIIPNYRLADFPGGNNPQPFMPQTIT